MPTYQRVQFWFQTNQLTTTVRSGRLVVPKHRLMTLAQREQNFRLWPLSRPNNEHHPRGRKSLHLGHFVDPSAEWLAILIWIDSILKIMVRVLSQLMVVQEFGDMRHIRYDWLINIFNHRKKLIQKSGNLLRSMWITTVALGNRCNDHNGLIEERLAAFTTSIYCSSYCLSTTHCLLYGPRDAMQGGRAIVFWEVWEEGSVCVCVCVCVCGEGSEGQVKY